MATKFIAKPRRSGYGKSTGFSDLAVGNSTEILKFIRSQLLRVPGPTKETRRYVNIVCPFHDDHSPSLGIRIAFPTEHAPLGSITCFSCKKTGDWNTLAKRLNLKPLPKSAKSAVEDSVDLSVGPLMDDLLGVESLTVPTLLRTLTPRITVHRPWPEYVEWRGFSGKFLTQFGAVEMTRESKRGGTYRELFLPVYVEGNLVGGVTCALKKRKNAVSYHNTPGVWSRDRGLFPYDQCLPLIEKHGYVLLVEGPRDALRLLRDGIPAICVLGVSSFSQKKALLIAATGADRVFVLGDGDKAGREFNADAYSILEPLVPTKAIKLPLDGSDPCSLDEKMVEKIRAIAAKTFPTT